MLLLLTTGLAAGLDQIEVGGPWGSPTATDGTAPWWNPAAMAMGQGHRYQLELAPSFAVMTYTRSEPNPGEDVYLASGLLPQVGFVTDLGVEGLGVGGALVVPNVRGGVEQEEPGIGRYTLRDGRIRTIYGIVGMGFRPVDAVAVGGMVAVVNSSFVAKVDRDTLPDLAGAIEAAGNTHDYTDLDLENAHYSATTSFDTRDIVMTAGASLMLRPHPKLDIGVAYIHGPTVENVGSVDLAFQCPPQEDEVGRFAAESRGLCDTDLSGNAVVSYRLPNRVQAGIAYRPTVRWRLEGMGGWVGWSGLDAVTITISETAELNPDLPEETAAVLDGTKVQNRDQLNSIWGAFDAKWSRPVLGSQRVTLGGRVWYDRAAVPDTTLASNNYDADALMLTGMGAYAPHPGFELGLSWTHHVLETRTADSAYYQSVEAPNAGGYDYPHSNGTYAGVINRFGVQVRGAF